MSWRTGPRPLTWRAAAGSRLRRPTRRWALVLWHGRLTASLCLTNRRRERTGRHLRQRHSDVWWRHPLSRRRPRRLHPLLRRHLMRRRLLRRDLKWCRCLRRGTWRRSRAYGWLHCGKFARRNGAGRFPLWRQGRARAVARPCIRWSIIGTWRQCWLRGCRRRRIRRSRSRSRDIVRRRSRPLRDRLPLHGSRLDPFPGSRENRFG